MRKFYRRNIVYQSAKCMSDEGFLARRGVLELATWANVYAYMEACMLSWLKGGVEHPEHPLPPAVSVPAADEAAHDAALAMPIPSESDSGGCGAYNRTHWLQHPRSPLMREYTTKELLSIVLTV
jgi:hypothetical protein